MPHYVILTPWEAPLAYLWFLIDWLSSAVCIGVAIYFFRRGHGNWWLIFAFAFAVPLLSHVFVAVKHGLPPIPYGLQETVKFPSTVESPVGITSGTTLVTTKTALYTNTLVPLVSIAMFMGYLHDKRTSL
jgi:hypothetical protein